LQKWRLTIGSALTARKFGVHKETHTVMRSGRTHCRLLLLGLALIATNGLSTLADAQGGKLRFGVGPLQPTPSETKKAYEPFFAYLAKELGRDFELTATTDWAGISVALASKQVDLAWSSGPRRSRTSRRVRSRPPRRRAPHASR
jgi:ABC-type amino acid transport substrate-binding protein